MGYRHSSIDEYKVLKTIYELMMVAMMTTPGNEQKKQWLNVANYVSTERDACAIRAAKSKAEAARQSRAAKEKNKNV